MSRIVFNPKILGGKPVIRGTRMAVEFILGLLASGMTADEIIHEYPQLTARDIRAVLSYAAAVIKREEVISPIQAATA